MQLTDRPIRDHHGQGYERHYRHDGDGDHPLGHELRRFFAF